ncbi:MAG TPA: hypothetical protein VHG08_16145 [Longimicrobium sp.]|nr:hypothetical protein [Longimicrobium sp.]
MASPLTLFMPVIPGTNPETIAATLAQYQQQLHDALTSIGTVHYARTLYLDLSQPNLQPVSATSQGPFVIAVITEYDGSFDAYIGDFVAQVGDVFNALLQFVVGGQALIPVQSNVAAFTAFIEKNDASQHFPNTSMYSAYPQTVQQILAAFGG